MQWPRRRLPLLLLLSCPYLQSPTLMTQYPTPATPEPQPTNYLDRDSLGALVAAIHDYKGGVIIISHNREFAGAVCQEKWIMDKGRLVRAGLCGSLPVCAWFWSCLGP